MKNRTITVTDYKTFELVYQVAEELVAVGGSFISNNCKSFDISAMPIKDYLEYECSSADCNEGQICVSSVIWKTPATEISFDMHGRLQGGKSFADPLKAWVANFPGGGRHIPTGFKGSPSLHLVSAKVDGIPVQLGSLGWNSKEGHWDQGFVPTQDGHSVAIC